ncbi:HNH endonuclease [uncultured Oscillibacter sp.]|jgi:5-methylcytosine-specific restriction protein A|uniref:HNH endonuclease signature motif containing protein n=1 Tax=uncultured Oscillibacter sp. TaxID=876091 RepID=UPI002634F387|nr:HNH endonuclease [uncultured Oscillibacter sp.]
MAMKPIRPCRHPGCGQLTRDGYCSAHRPQQQPRSPEAAAWRRWYSRKIWTDDLRPGQLLREPFCRECARRGLRTTATEVDHIRDHKGDWALFTDRENLQSLCHSCHSRKTIRENGKKRRNF